MAGIIKASEVHRQGAERGAAAVRWIEVPDPTQEAEAARRQAAELVAEARREAEQIRKSAAEQGMADAHRQAQQAMRQELEARIKTLLPALEKVIHEFHALRQQWLQQWEKNVIALACAIASRILRREVEQDPQVPLTILRESLELACGWNRVIIELHPDDVETLTPVARAFTEQWNRAAQVQFVANVQIEKGSCRVSGEWGQIDQRWSCQLRRIQEELTP